MSGHEIQLLLWEELRSCSVQYVSRSKIKAPDKECGGIYYIYYDLSWGFQFRGHDWEDSLSVRAAM